MCIMLWQSNLTKYVDLQILGVTESYNPLKDNIYVKKIYFKNKQNCTNQRERYLDMWVLQNIWIVG